MLNTTTCSWNFDIICEEKPMIKECAFKILLKNYILRIFANTYEVLEN